jgi:hypothetical protein
MARTGPVADLRNGRTTGPRPVPPHVGNHVIKAVAQSGRYHSVTARPECPLTFGT